MVKPTVVYVEEDVDKAGYNQAARITEILANLRNTYTSLMIYDDYPASLKVCRRVLDIISAKLKDDEIKESNKKIVCIKSKFKGSEQTYIHGGAKWHKYPKEREEVEKEIENLWRHLEKLQDTHGYGMISEEDYGL